MKANSLPGKGLGFVLFPRYHDSQLFPTSVGMSVAALIYQHIPILFLLLPSDFVHIA